MFGNKKFETRICKILDDVKNLNNLNACLPDSVIYYTELLKGNKPKKKKQTEENENIFDDKKEEKENENDESGKSFCTVL